MYYMTTNSKITGIVWHKIDGIVLGRNAFTDHLMYECILSKIRGGHLVLSCFTTPMHTILSTWKLNAFTCFAASSWGERIVEVDACGVQLVFGKHGFDY